MERDAGEARRKRRDVGKTRRLRRGQADELGLRRALTDRLLPSLVGAMAFLAALALAGVIGAESVARHWRLGAGGTLTVQVPEPEVGTRVRDVLAALRGTAGVVSARALEAGEMEALLRPWLGAGAERVALPMPAVIEVRLAEGADAGAGLEARLAAVAPGTVAEENGAWLQRLGVLARSVQACAAFAMALVGFVAVAVVTVATRAGLATRRDAIEIVHGLGATDGFIAGQFARRTTALAGGGALVGAVLAVPVLAGLGHLAAPFVGGSEGWGLEALPSPIWLGVPLLPVVAAGLGWVTAQWTVRRWLRRLP